MEARLRGFWVGIACWLLVSTAVAWKLAAADERALVVGLDHVIVAVEDLEAAAASYRALGFSIKPGRPHANGIRNRHVKFPDGSEIELLTAPEARDPLTRTYRRHLESAGDGPAFAGLFAPDREPLMARLRAMGWSPYSEGLVTFERESPVHALFFGRRNRARSDRPEHFDHRNGATRLVGAWVAPDTAAPWLELLGALGARLCERPWPGLGGGVRATVAFLPEGFVALLPVEHRLSPGRPVIGATVEVRDLAAAADATAGVEGVRRIGTADAPGLVLPPAATHGLYLELGSVRERPSAGRSPIHCH